MEADEELRSLMFAQLEAQQALVDASKKEAIAATLQAEEYKRLQALEKERIAEQKRTNELQERRLEEAVKIYNLLMYNFERKPIEQIIEQLRKDVAGRLDWLSVILEGVRAISDLVARELLRVLSKETNNSQDKKSLMEALVKIGQERSKFDLGTHFSSQGDIHTRDVGDKTNTED
jgi:hypothetical protein